MKPVTTAVLDEPCTLVANDGYFVFAAVVVLACVACLITLEEAFQKRSGLLRIGAGLALCEYDIVACLFISCHDERVFVSTHCLYWLDRVFPQVAGASATVCAAVLALGARPQQRDFGGRPRHDVGMFARHREPLVAVVAGRRAEVLAETASAKKLRGLVSVCCARGEAPEWLVQCPLCRPLWGWAWLALHCLEGGPPLRPAAAWPQLHPGLQATQLAGCTCAPAAAAAARGTLPNVRTHYRGNTCSV